MKVVLITVLAICLTAPTALSVEGAGPAEVIRFDETKIVNAGQNSAFTSLVVDGTLLVQDAAPLGRAHIIASGPIVINGLIVGGLASTSGDTAHSGIDIVIESADQIVLSQHGIIVAADGLPGHPSIVWGTTDVAQGQHGGRGGSITLIAPQITIEGQLIPGRGGNGGSALAYNSDSQGGAGGIGGIVTIIDSVSAWTFSGATPGNGGDALTTSNSEFCIDLPGPGEKIGMLMEKLDEINKMQSETCVPSVPLPGLLGGLLDGLINDIPSLPGGGMPGGIGLLAVGIPCSDSTAKGGEGGTGLFAGGRGGDAILDNSVCTGSPGTAGSDGNVFACYGRDGGAGGDGKSATATGGAGGAGGVTGGDGGNADAAGGAGGPGGKGGNGAIPVSGAACPGGNGGQGGAGGSATANGGNGGRGYCSGGIGGAANAHGGASGAGGSGGYVGGAPGPSGQSGSSTPRNGNTGERSGNC